MDRAEGYKAIVLTADATVGAIVRSISAMVLSSVGMPIVEEYLPEGAGKSMDFVYKSAKQRLSPRDVELSLHTQDFLFMSRGPMP